MKYFKCTVCGFIHEGPRPPAKCPVCGAPREKFEAMAEQEGGKAREEYKARMSQRWPEIMAKLAQIEKAEDAAAPAPPKRPALLEFIFARMARNHAHPMAVHFPNGIMPATVLFLFLALAFQIAHMKEAAFYNLLFVTLTLPGVLFAGYVDWQVRMGGTMTRPILTKIISGICALIVGVVLVVWYIINPDVASVASASRWTYFIVHLLMLSFIALAGYLGGELVFKD
ncbi:MAG TPA: DUF2231 domain-containing protein [bacterium]|nr:DUF2231 domain-containing protein [bacterium]